MPRSISPLRYPGGKNKLYNYTKSLIENNNLIGCTYAEPFAGGCGLALQLLHNDIVQNLVLNDIDTSIYNFWNAVLNDADELIHRIDVTDINIESWYIQKEIYQNKELYTNMDVAFATLFLNRTNYSGILKAGPLGGYNQNGNYLIDCRFNKNGIINRIELINNYRDNIEFHNLDAIDFLDYLQQNANNEEQHLVFLDPPYYKKGSELYINYYKHDDHVLLHDRLIDFPLPWVTTYDNQDEIKEIYADCNNNEYDISYTLEKKYTGKELMFLSNQIY